MIIVGAFNLTAYTFTVALKFKDNRFKVNRSSGGGHRVKAWYRLPPLPKAREGRGERVGAPSPLEDRKEGQSGRIHTARGAGSPHKSHWGPGALAGDRLGPQGWGAGKVMC